jgi:hypothetical protein
MLKIQFQLDPSDESVHEFDLGHFLIETEGLVVTSRDRVPDQSMMVFIAASDFLGGMVDMLDKKKKRYEFVGCDSSFILNFIRNKKDEIEIMHNKKKLCSVGDVELINAAYNASNELIQMYGQGLAGSGAAKKDLDYTLHDAKERMGYLLASS